jgi:hypothetical protein
MWVAGQHRRQRRKTRPEEAKAEPKRHQSLCEPAQGKTSREHNPTIMFAKLSKEVKEISIEGHYSAKRNAIFGNVAYGDLLRDQKNETSRRGGKLSHGLIQSETALELSRDAAVEKIEQPAHCCPPKDVAFGVKSGKAQAEQMSSAFPNGGRPMVGRLAGVDL